MSCLVIHPAIIELRKSFPQETLSSVKNMVGLWQEREIAKGTKGIDIESVPDVDTLRALYDEVRNTNDVSVKLSKEDFSELLDEKELPAELVSLAKRLGIRITINRKSHTLEMSKACANDDDFRLFKSLAIDLVYGGEEFAQRAFGMDPRERLAAVIDWESRYKKGNAKDVDIMNYELQLAKRTLRDEHGLSTDGVMEALRKQAAEAFTSKDRLERITDITDWFDRIVTERLEEKLDELSERQEQLREYIRNNDKQDFPDLETALTAYEQELGDIQRELSSYGRIDVIKELGPKAIFDEIRQKFVDVASLSDDDAAFIAAMKDTFGMSNKFVKKNLAWYKDQIQKVIDNFEVLRDEACRELEQSELVRISITFDDALDTQNEEKHADENTDGEDEGDVSGIENQYKENWMYEFDTVSNWSKMSAQVRHMLYKCPLGKRRTRFGSDYHVPAMQVVNTLIAEMQGVTNSRDMDAVLESLEKDYPWVSYIRKQIAGSKKLKTQLFRSIRRYQQTLGIIQRSSKSGTVDYTRSKLKIVNSGNTVNSIYSGVQIQIASGVPINKSMTIFDGEDLKISHISDIKEMLEPYAAPVWHKGLYGGRGGYGEEGAKDFWEATPENISEVLENYPDICEDIAKALRALGFSVKASSIRLLAARDVKKNVLAKNNFNALLLNINKILEKIEENGYETVDDLLNEDPSLTNRAVLPYFRTIAEILTLYDNGAVEASIRENGKVRYSNVLPSVLDDLIVGFQGKSFSHINEKGVRINKSISEFIEDKFGDDPRFAERNEDGSIHYRNYVLEVLANGEQSISTYGPSYVTILNVDTKGRRKTEQKNMTQQDRLNMVWSMYEMDSPYENAQGTWYPIPLPSDSGRIAFIRFVPITDESERRKIIKDAIIKELERMTDTNDDAHLPETFRKNKGKFCVFPVLNNPELTDGYEVSDVISEFNEARNTDQWTTFDITMEHLVDAVVDAMVNKLREENESFYKSQVKDRGQEETDAAIVDQSIFQMAMNEIINGDPAYYTGYNTGSDNIQKRAKQSIVPLDHIDIFNEDFQEAYRRYHNIDDDVVLVESVNDPIIKELEENGTPYEVISEHCLYIEDPLIPSPSFDDLKSLYLDALNDGIIDQDTYDAFLASSSSIKYTDGQCFRSFDSMVYMMYALGEMEKDDELDLALHRIASGKQQPGDSYIVRTALKPFLSGLVPIEENDGTTRLMPVQHKLSEQILTAALVQADGTKVGSSPALRALSRILEEQHADVAIFTSGVKEGQNGAINFGELDVESASEDEIVQKMNDEINAYQQKTGKSIIHRIPYSYYGIVAQNPDSGMDDSEIPIGVQLQKLLAADLPDEIVTTSWHGGKVEHREKAVYHVEGVGDLSRDEIIALYNKLMTEKILRAYREIQGKFADKNELSKELQRACRNSSRGSGYLERAFSLDEYGNFVIPLCDLATLNMSSEFLNSIVKNAVSKIKSPGKQLVSMSAFGFAKDLRIEFERDEDGYPIAYKSIDCLLPAWSRHIVNKCIDENGMIDFEKLQKESPRLCKLIGVRIPTQFKNFILPLRCVGFLPTILGDTIVTAIDSVPMLDADFDNDKIPTLFPSFDADYMVDNWERKAYSDYKKYVDQWYDFDLMHATYKLYMKELRKRGVEKVNYKFEDFYHNKREESNFKERFGREDAPEGEPMTFGQYKREHKSEYLRPDGPKLKYIEYDDSVDIKDQSDEAINNGIISVMIGMLTGKAVSTMSIAVGSPEKLDPVIKELEAVIPKKTYPDGPADIATRIAQETRNNDGKQMISVFANAEAMQAMLQHTHVGLVPGAGVTINGRTLESLHEVKIENSLEYISRYIGTSLGAAADNSKKPRLATLNINLRTAPVVSLMLMLGYDIREVGYFLNIPSIRKFTDTNDKSLLDGIDEEHELPGDLNDMLHAISLGDDYKSDEDVAEYCEKALGVFKYLLRVGERMRMMSSLARGDSGSSAPHGPIENNLVRYLNYELFAEMEEEDPIFENWREIVNYDYDNEPSEERVANSANPITQAFIEYGVVGAFRELAKYYPGIGDPNFRNQIKTIIKKYYGGVATVANVKNIMYALYNFVESSFDCVRKEGMTIAESRDYYLNVFPEEAAKIIAEHQDVADSLLFRRLKLFSTLDKDSNPFISMKYDGTMLPMTRDEFTAVWQQLFYAKKSDGSTDTELQQLAIELFKYCYYRNGFRFSDGTYAHLAPAEARLFWPGYAEMLDAMQEGLSAEVYRNFESQFVRNNLYDTRFCQTVPLTSDVLKPDEWVDSVVKRHEGAPEKIVLPYWSKMDKTHQDAFEWYYGPEETRGEQPRVAFAITQKMEDGSIKYNYYMRVADNDVRGESTYVLVTPLGWGDKAVEYSANEPGVSMQSSFDQDVVGESLREERSSKRKTRKNGKNKTSRNTRSSDENSSEEPNSSDDEMEDMVFNGFPASSLYGQGYKVALEMYPDIVKGKKFQAARAAFMKAKKSGKIKTNDKAKSKTKEQVSREKSGGNKSKKVRVIPLDKKSTVMSAEQHCAGMFGSYTICVTDNSSSQLRAAIHTATPNDKHFVSDLFEKGNEDKFAKQLAKNLARKKSKSIILNLTGSYINTIGRVATQEDLDAYVLSIYRALKKEGIYISKVVSTGQPGIPLASVRAAIELGYNLEVYPTSDYQVYSEVGGGSVASKDSFMSNIDSDKVSKDYKKDNLVYDKEDGPFIIAKNNWTRDIVSKDKKTLYIFTDNTDRTSGTNAIPSSSRYSKKYGRRLSYPNTTSAVIRGLENAFPLSVQKKYSKGSPVDGQWTDADLSEFRRVISDEINDIIEAFESGVYKRVVLPVGGVFDGPIADISKTRTPKLYKELMKQMEMLEDRINEISETQVDDKNEYDAGYETDPNDVLSGDEIVPISMSGKNDSGEDQRSNVYVVKVSDLADGGIKILTSSGKTIAADKKLFIVLPKDGILPTAKNWGKAKIYSSSGVRITEDILFTLPSDKKKYNIISATENGLPLAMLKEVANELRLNDLRPYNKAGLTWLDDNNKPLC